MLRVLFESGRHLRCPATGKNLYGTHIQIPVVEVILKARHMPDHEASILANAVTTHWTDSSRNPLCQEIQCDLFSLLRGVFARPDPINQTGTGVVRSVPLVHSIKNRIGLVDRYYRPLCKYLQLGVSNYSGDLYNLVCARRVQWTRYRSKCPSTTR